MFEPMPRLYRPIEEKGEGLPGVGLLNVFERFRHLPQFAYDDLRDAVMREYMKEHQWMNDQLEKLKDEYSKLLTEHAYCPKR